jgi:head-tail adaptor
MVYKSKYTFPCIGDMDSKINLFYKGLTYVNDESAEAETQAIFKKDVDAKVTSYRGGRGFDGINMLSTPTHFMYIRYIEDFSGEYLIQFNRKWYDIIDYINLEERNRFIMITVREQGRVEQKASFLP